MPRLLYSHICLLIFYFFQCVCLWRLREVFWVKVLSQTSHACGRSLVCTRWCRTRCSFRKKRLLHTSHLKRRSLLWERRCTVRYLFSTNDFPHVSHVNGRSWVECVASWYLRVSLYANRLLQNWHMNGRSELWLLWCFTRFLLRLNCFLQSLHLKGYSLMWTRWCSLRVGFCLNRLLQILHSKGRFWCCNCCSVAVICSWVLYALLPATRYTVTV